jgi:hypothetical protein
VEPPSIWQVAGAALPLLLIVALGLTLPLQRLRQIDVCRTLSID